MLTESSHNTFLLWALGPRLPVLQEHTLHLLLLKTEKNCHGESVRGKMTSHAQDKWTRYRVCSLD